MSIEEDRQVVVALRQRYRDVARAAVVERLGEHSTVNEHANVNIATDGDGAFFECVIWVPAEAVK